MIIQFEDLFFRSVQEKDLEMLRTWRNDTLINQYLFDQREISESDQKKWFRNNKDSTNICLIIGEGDTDIGLLSLTKFNESKTECTSNIFIGNRKYLGSHYPILLSIVFCEVGFDYLNIKRVFAEVLEQNIGAIKLNEALGFEKQEYGASKGCIPYLLTPDLYQQKRKKLLRLLKITYNVQSIHIKVQANFFGKVSDNLSGFDEWTIA